MLPLPCRSIRRGRVHNEAAIWHVGEDGAIRENRVTNPGEVRVRMEAQWQASRRVDGEAVVVEHEREGG